MDIIKTIDILKEEYFHLQKAIETFVQKALNIKGWSITVSMSGIAASFTTDKYSNAILILAAGASLLFWLIELSWKMFQSSHYKRVKEIEEVFQNEQFNDPKAKLSIYKSWNEEYSKKKYSWRLIRMFFWPHVCLPHIVIIILGTVVYFCK